VKTLLITGYNGLIGKSLLSELTKNPSFNILGLGRSGNDKVKTIHVDLSENWDQTQLPDKVDVVIHLAQSEKFREFPGSALEVFNVNTQSTLRLLDYARQAGATKFIYASSGGVYGNSDIGFNEEDPLQPNKDLGFYLTTKFCSELLVQNYSQFLEINILRLFFVFGEDQRKNMLIPRLIDSVKNGKLITLQGKEGIKINPIYVQDAARAIINILGKKGSFNVNIGGSEIVSIKQLSELIGKYVGKAPVFEYQNTEAKNLIGDITKMRKIYEPVISMEHAIQKMTLNEQDGK
jgi:nucleoside-diphosphate-sugar epimerase